MTKIVDFTVWNIETREPYTWGRCVEDTMTVEAGFEVYYGAQARDTTHIFNEDGEPVERTTPPPRSAGELNVEINRERTRRIMVGKVIDGVHVTGSDADRANLSDLALAAQLRLAAGDSTTTTTFRDGDNVDHDLTPMQIISIWQRSATHVSAIYAASWSLKAMDPIPADVTADAYWP